MAVQILFQAAQQRSPRRRFLTLAGGTGTALLAAACGGEKQGSSSASSGTAATTGAGPQTAAPAKEPKSGGVLTTRGTQPEASLSPIHQPGSDVRSLSLDTIYDFVWTEGAGGKVQLMLAEKYETPDPTTVVVTLRPAKFHSRAPTNGRALTAEDVKFTHEYIISQIPKNANAAGFLEEEVAGVRVLSPSTLEVKLKRPSAFFFEQTGFARPILAREVTEKDIRTHEPIGSGPFMYKARTAGSTFEMERNPEFRDPPRPYLAGRKLLIIKDDAAAEAAFIAGNIDIWSVPNPPTADRLRGKMGDKIRIEEAPALIFQGFNMNPKRPELPFADQRVRQAFYRIVDHQALINVIHFGKATLSGPVAPGWTDLALSQDELRPVMKHDLTEAKQLLQAAGFPFERSFELAYSGDDSEHGAIAQILVEQFKAAGVKINPTPFSRAELPQRVSPDPGQWDLYLNVSNPTIERIFRLQHTDPRAPNQGVGIDQPDIDRMIEATEQEPDAGKRIVLYKTLQRELLKRYMNFMPLYAARNLTALYTYVQGVDTSGRPGRALDTAAWLDK